MFFPLIRCGFNKFRTTKSLFYSSFSCVSIGMDLKSVVSTLNSFAPLHYAEKWDNVGLLLEPSDDDGGGGKGNIVERILLTNDLTEDVLNEAFNENANLIISYHPPIFASFKRLVASASWKERIVVRCLERRVALYSPHTSWDVVQGGVNEWLASALDCSDVKPILKTSSNSDIPTHSVSLKISREIVNKSNNGSIYSELVSYLSSTECDSKVSSMNDSSEDLSIHTSCDEKVLKEITKIVESNQDFVCRLRVVKLEKIPIFGVGRLCFLKESISLEMLIEIIKKHLKLDRLRVAIGRGVDINAMSIKSVALCAGAGVSVVGGSVADVYWTGEMSHHDVLDAVSRGISVVLCEHSNTERGFLNHFAPKLVTMLDNKVKVFVSQADRDPLVVV